ncbi:ABC transporter ATP-binding protein [Fulvivirga sedimenti]|uniref:ABC transporter ATP-binding protein/permease n=1 Tax=Fulvivirga sedimenti TaxID=2879465 RepID=A0A9X1L1A3_9BACT|nr:ABC transporter ATP-binding protein [Fulvivirga sedimenti]MCA6078017.1 ABC transporter ATP-binding protein/permease [Fulvivirga sedimenti]
MKTFFRVFGYAQNIGVRFTLYGVYMLISVIFSAVNLAMLMPLLKVLFNPGEEGSVPVNPGPFRLNIDYVSDYFNFYFNTIIAENGPARALLFVCIVVFFSVFITNIFRYLSSIVSAKIRLDVIKNIRMKVYDRVTSLHIGYFSNERKGDLISRMTNDVLEVDNTILASPKSLFREPVTIIVYFIVLFKISFELTIFTILVLPVAGGILSEIVRRLKRRAIQSQESLGRIVNILDETIGGMRIIKAFNAKKYVTRVMEEENEHYRKVNLSYYYKKELGSPVSEFLGVGIVLIIMYYGGTLVLNQTSSLEASEFITYLAIFSQIISPAKSFSQAFSGIQKGIISASRIFSVIDKEPEIRDTTGAVNIERFSDSIVFDNVDFAYNEDNKVLRNINLKIGRGQSVALVGPSGGGKSTLADLLPRFYDPTAGRVLLDGRPLTDYTLESLRSQMAIVTQESILFNDTVFNNIAFGLGDADPDRVIHAAQVANAHDFIMELPEGYNTNIGDRGLKLSGGQRQRLSIARAVMKDPAILILDEATSALDSESELLVQEALTNLMANRTSLVIAHRLSTIQHADKIVVIQDGQIIETGTHDELVSRGGMYKKLSVMQNT